MRARALAITLPYIPTPIASGTQSRRDTTSSRPSITPLGGQSATTPLGEGAARD